MRRFVFTSNGFSGSFEAMYDNNGRLLKIDFSNATITEKAISWFKTRMPVIIDNLEAAFDGVNCKYKEEDIEVSFEDFWRVYPHKRNRHLAEAYWHKMTSNEQYLAFVAAIDYRKYCELNTWYNAKIAESWLKTKEFKNNWKKM